MLLGKVYNQDDALKLLNQGYVRGLLGVHKQMEKCNDNKKAVHSHIEMEEEI